MKMSYNDFRDLLLNHMIVKWNGDNEITLDNGITVSIEETEQDCCASAFGRFENVKLDAAIVDVSEPSYKYWEDCDTYGTEARVKILYNDLDFCTAYANADAGNGGYYFSIASFVIRFPKDFERKEVYLVQSGDGQ